MTSSYPSTLDTFVDPIDTGGNFIWLDGSIRSAASDPATIIVPVNPALVHENQHANVNDAIAAIQTKVGIDGSAVITSIDYLLKSPLSIDPGHFHTAASLDVDSTLINTGSLGLNLSNANIWTAEITSSFTPSTSGSAFLVTGVPVGGNGTTATPLFYFDTTTASAPTSWNASGTYLGLNCLSTFTGSYIDIHKDGGASIWLINNGGTILTSGGFYSTNTGAGGFAVIAQQGTLLIGGTTTTNLPQYLAQAASGTTAVTSWSTSGTYFGANAASVFAGNFVDFHINGGASLFKIDSTGGVTCAGVAHFNNGLGTTFVQSSGGYQVSYSPAPAAAGILMTGSTNITGTGTTTFPYVFYTPTAATAVTSWSTAGTIFGANPISSFAGNFIDFHINGGASLFKIDSTGGVTCAGVAHFNNGLGTTFVQSSGGYQLTYSPGLSASGILMTGTANAAGTGTTTFPYVYYVPTGVTAVSTWSGAGTIYGANAQASFAGNFIDMHLNGGVSLFTVDASGNVFGANLVALNAGNGLQIKSGSNARIGTGTLSGGTLAVANTSVTANTRVFLQDTNAGSLTNVGSLTVVTNAGVGFTVTSTNILDVSTFNYILVESN